MRNTRTLLDTEANALDDALYAWRNRMHERGMIDASNRPKVAARHDREVVDMIRTVSITQTIEVR